MKTYQELGIESFQSRWGYRKLAMFFKTYKSKGLFYLFKLILEKISSYVTRKQKTKTKRVKHKKKKFKIFNLIVETNELKTLT